MTVTSRAPFDVERSFVDTMTGLYVPWQAEPAPDPRLLVLNEDLADELGIDVEWLGSTSGVAVLAGNAIPPGATPVAMAYAGHQFGGYSPRLGDGRALLLGELTDRAGRRRDLHLKGSGRTPFARGGDGKAAVGPMLREFLIGEAMHGLGIPTTRALSVVATGEDIARETMLPGAVLARIAASHLRVGTFEYAARLQDDTVLPRLVRYAVTRHHPALAGAENPARALLDAVVDAQASLIARWMLVGFIHGVMNTDNMTISGETIDYGPCAFMDTYDPATVFSSIDHGGRYAYGNQPAIGQWNLARLAETLLPLIDADSEAAVASATAVLDTYPERFTTHWNAGMRAKLGLEAPDHADDDLFGDLLSLLRDQQVDWTSSFRALAAHLRGDDGPIGGLFADRAAFDAWAERWRARLAAEGREPAAVAEGMDRVNPVNIARNHLVEEALAAAGEGDLAPFEALLVALRRPYDELPGMDRYRAPAPADFSGRFRTFCGT